MKLKECCFSEKVALPEVSPEVYIEKRDLLWGGFEMKHNLLNKKIVLEWRFPKVWLLIWISFCGSCVFALPMGEKEIGHFEREVLKTVKELLRMSGDWHGNNFIVRLKEKNVRNVKVKNAEIVFEGIPTASRESFLGGEFDFEKFREIKGVAVEGILRPSDIQQFIDTELGRQKPERKIISRAAISFGKGRVTATGLVDLTKIPGNPLGFIPQSLSPFQATFSVQQSGSQLTIDIAEAQVNGQPMTPELRTTVYNWLNPLWDFSKLPYAAGLDEIDISSDGLSFKGFLFSN